MGRTLLVEKIKGKKVFRFGPTLANDDWIRSARLIKQGKVDEVRKRELEPLFSEPFSKKDVNEVEELRKLWRKALVDVVTKAIVDITKEINTIEKGLGVK